MVDPTPQPTPVKVEIPVAAALAGTSLAAPSLEKPPIWKNRTLLMVVGGALLFAGIVYAMISMINGRPEARTVYGPTPTPAATADLSVTVSPTPSSSASVAPSTSPVASTNLTYRSQANQISFVYPSTYEVTSRSASANYAFSVAVYDTTKASTSSLPAMEITVYTTAAQLGKAKGLTGTFTTVDDVLGAATAGNVFARWTRGLTGGQLSYTAETGKKAGTGDMYYFYSRNSSEVVEVIDRARSAYSSGIRASLNIFAQ